MQNYYADGPVHERQVSVLTAFYGETVLAAVAAVKIAIAMIVVNGLVANLEKIEYHYFDRVGHQMIKKMGAIDGSAHEIAIAIVNEIANEIEIFLGLVGPHHHLLLSYYYEIGSNGWNVWNGWNGWNGWNDLNHSNFVAAAAADVDIEDTHGHVRTPERQQQLNAKVAMAEEKPV